jgi:hypothetical protein
LECNIAPRRKLACSVFREQLVYLAVLNYAKESFFICLSEEAEIALRYKQSSELSLSHRATIVSCHVSV